MRSSIILLLDYDGVVHSADAGPTGENLRATPPILDRRVFSRVPILEQAVHQLEAHQIDVAIHLTTSWRTILPLEVCRGYLGNYLSERTKHAVSSLGKGISRGEEVLTHLTQQGLLNQSWLCIDDNPSLYWDILDSTEFKDRLLIIDGPDGMTEDDKQQLVTLALHQCVGEG